MFLAIRIAIFCLTVAHHFVIGENVWSNWSSWSTCSQPARQHTRFRECLDANGKALNPNQCPGLSQRTRQCESCSYSLLNRNVRYSGMYATTEAAWCVSELSYETKYVEISFENFVQLTGIGTRGHGNGYVKKYRIEHSYDGEEWFSYNEFPGNMDASHVRNNTFKSRLVTRYVRIYPTSYTARACFKAQLQGCSYNCGGLITHDAPVIRPPSPSNHIEELNCLWRVESRAAKRLQLKFSYFKLFCKNGMLELFDGRTSYIPNNDENIIEAFCGHSSGVSSHLFEGGALWMRYHTNATTSDIDFKIQVNAFVAKTLNGTFAKIVQPNIGYSNIYRYSWMITAPRNNDTIELSLDYFFSNNTRVFGSKCVGDVIIIHYGNEGQTLVKKYCEINRGKIFTSTTGFMKVKYKSKTNNPNWKIGFSYKILGYPTPTTLYTTQHEGDTTIHKRTERGTLPSNKVNDTNFEATQKKQLAENSTEIPIIVSCSLAALIAIVCVVALAHYLRKRSNYLKKHPYDCSNRPMSHFGEQDATPFINTNLLMWNDSRNLEKSEKPKNFEKSKKSLPFIEVTLRENEPQRLSIIPPEMLNSSSAASIGIPIHGNEETGTLKVSDNFTEECMKLLNNNLSSALEDDDDEYNPEENTEIMPGKFDEIYGSLPEVDRRSPEVDDSNSVQESLPEAETPETDKLLNN